MIKRVLFREDGLISKFLLFGVLGLIMSFVFVSCEKYELKSRWRDRDIDVDGRSLDWLDILTYVEEFSVSIGIANDTDYLYICAVVENPLVRMQVLRQGLTVWFDPKGGRKKAMGLRFPLGFQGKREPPAEFGEEPDIEKLQRMFLMSLNELEILGPDRKEKQRMKKAEAKGVDVAMSVSSGKLVYELRIPLIKSSDRPYAVNVQPGSSFGIGIETSSRRDMGQSPQRKTGGMSRPVGGRNPGVGGRGGMGQMPGGGRPGMPRNLKLWLSVSLSQENSSY